MNEVDLLLTGPKPSPKQQIDSNQNDNNQESIDEVDFVYTPSTLSYRVSDGKPYVHSPSAQTKPKSILKTDALPSDGDQKLLQHKIQSPPASPHQQQQQQQSQSTSDLVNAITSTIERKLPFPFHRKRSDPTNHQTTAGKERPKFVKCSSIARLFGNTYSTQPVQSTKNDAKRREAEGKTPTVGNLMGVKIERFRMCSESHVENGNVDSVQSAASLQVKDNCDDKDLSAKAFRTISRSLGRLWRRSHSVDISVPDPEYKVLYLGNVLTGWAKGERNLFLSTYY